MADDDAAGLVEGAELVVRRAAVVGEVVDGADAAGGEEAEGVELVVGLEDRRRAHVAAGPGVGAVRAFRRAGEHARVVEDRDIDRDLAAELREGVPRGVGQPAGVVADERGAAAQRDEEHARLQPFPVVGGERADDGAAAVQHERVERLEPVEREPAVAELLLERLVAEPEFVLDAGAGRRGAVDREDAVDRGDAGEPARLVDQVGRLEVVLVGVRHEQVAHAAQDVAVRLPGLEAVRTEVDLDVSAEVVAGAGADVGAAAFRGFAADAAVAEDGGDALGGGGTEDQQFGFGFHGRGGVGESRTILPYRRPGGNRG